ncbi:PHP domain-containing protein [Desulfosporosinus nitroreducens]|uniref:PHP domain-containing protein n=1 Tax=Desulfosporosinus nitroreducens TaxID=2018668 RepID=A0ABT8QJF9_9FIRM|nr:PHP domain-containing protein [Desulfosporosinus nitroreducens]MCO1600350.1 PHP domain-containing protein [Desulfosporosinus nitroreducens]MDO0821438.1 PHP domain-containing protein [Desulfosporosinus nitroreducens]
MRSDLHIHTHESDGLLSVEEVINLAYANKIQTLAITDHESTQAINKAESLAKELDIKIIPGVELLTSYQGHEVHLLGYFNDVNHPVLQERLKELRAQRTDLAHDMVECLKNSGISLKWQDVEKEVGANGAVTKGHIMRAIYHQEDGNTQKNWREIAAHFRPGGVAYLPYLNHAFEDAVNLIFSCGGLPVVAHPGLLWDPQIVFALLAYRPIGLEVYYGYWERQSALIKYYTEVAENFAIIATGGSDYHGPSGYVKLGQMDIPYDSVLKLRSYLTI